MIYYIYDGTFEGLLTAIYQAYYRQDKPDYIVSAEEYSEDLFSQPVNIVTEPEKSEKVYRAIADKISHEALANVFYVFLSETKGLGTLVYRYLQLGWQVGSVVDAYLAREPVREVLRISQKVIAERHRLLGLVRFRQLSGAVYYASIEPDHNIVGLLAPHFAKRLADQGWIIHDLKRGLAALYNQKEWIITSLSTAPQLDYADGEELYQSLWKEYYAAIAIKDRTNPRLQKQFMPVRYWKHLIEKN